jgi:hypothetical protein
VAEATSLLHALHSGTIVAYHQSRLLKMLDVLGDRRLAQPESDTNLVDISVACRKQLENGQTRLVGKGPKDIGTFFSPDLKNMGSIPH